MREYALSKDRNAMIRVKPTIPARRKLYYHHVRLYRMLGIINFYTAAARNAAKFMKIC